MRRLTLDFMETKRTVINLDYLPPAILRAILETLRSSDEPTDYLIFIGKHTSGLTLAELGERFGKSQERMRQRLSAIHERIRVTYEALYAPSGSYSVGSERDSATPSTLLEI